MEQAHVRNPHTSHTPTHNQPTQPHAHTNTYTHTHTHIPQTQNTVFMEYLGEASEKYVSELRRRAEKRGEGTLVFVGNVPADTNSFALQDFLAQAGTAKSVIKVGGSFRVDFSDAKGAAAAIDLNGKIFGGKKLSISRTRPTDAPKPPSVVCPPPPIIPIVRRAPPPLVVGISPPPPLLLVPAKIVVPKEFCLEVLVSQDPALREALAKKMRERVAIGSDSSKKERKKSRKRKRKRSRRSRRD